MLRPTRFAVCWRSVEPLPSMSQNCLGRSSPAIRRDMPRRREPSPPANTTPQRLPREVPYVPVFSIFVVMALDVVDHIAGVVRVRVWKPARPRKVVLPIPPSAPPLPGRLRRLTKRRDIQPWTAVTQLAVRLGTRNKRLTKSLRMSFRFLLPNGQLGYSPNTASQV